MIKNININFALIPLYILATIIIIYLVYKMVKKIIDMVKFNTETQPLIYKPFIITC